MSYGRAPAYIYDCDCEGADDLDGHPDEPHVVFDEVVVPWPALMQFVWKLRKRGELASVLDGTHPQLKEKGAQVLMTLEARDP